MHLELPSVTLCAATSVNVLATLAAMERCLAQVRFADAILFTDAAVAVTHSAIRVIRIQALTTGACYSRFILRNLNHYISTAHCLVVQWDGFILDARAWDPEFLVYDYIGAPWPQFPEGMDVGNGGFSLRSRRLIEACARMEFSISHPEDIAICHRNRRFLQSEGIRFPERDLAARFSFERERSADTSFGFHGVFNLIEVMGADEFWKLYCGLDERSSAYLDAKEILSGLMTGHNVIQRCSRFIWDGIWHNLRPPDKLSTDPN